MYKLADSHIHLFDGGFEKSGVDEVAQYERLIEEHSIKAALVVGYEGQDWARGNNEFVATLARSRNWIHPVAFLLPTQLSISHLQSLANERYVGISLYLFSDEDVATVAKVPSEVWQWLVEHRWLISVNSKGHFWRVWEQVLKENPQLRLLISHVGLPQINNSDSPADAIAAELAPQVLLHQFPYVYLKLSGFYALEPTSPSFPYLKTHPYINYLLKRCDTKRLVWGSDFTPALGKVSFAETFTHLGQWISDEHLRSRLLHDNLIELLNK